MSKYDQIEQDLRASPRRFLVTGAAGFIGSHITDRLLSLNQKVLAVDNMSVGLQSNVDVLQAHTNSKNLEFLKADLCEKQTCDQLTKNVDIVIHQAAIGSVPRSIKEPLPSHHSNVNGFLNLLVSSTMAQVKRFVYASSSSVYGDDPNLPKVEGHEGEPLSPYAATKLIDEVYAKVFARCYGAPVIGLRYFNVFGPRQNPEGPYAAVIPLWIDAMVKGEDIFINGDGSYSRDFCYIENVVQANLLAAMCDDHALDRVFNVAFGDRTTLLELYQLIKTALNELQPNLQIPDPHHRDFREGDIPHSLADISQAKALLGYEPKFSVKQGLLETVKSFLEDAP